MRPASSNPTVWYRRCCVRLGWNASLLRADMIFGKDRAWAPSLGWLLPASPPGPAVTATELEQQLKPMAIDLALVRRSEEQLATNQDQLARKQDQMAQAIATLQAAQQDLIQQILALARPPTPRPVHVSPKPVQPPAQ